jgi:uncharacterized membrane protein YkoI
MRKIVTFIGSAIIAISVAALAIATDEPQKLVPKDVPAKIMQTVNARLPGAQVTSAERETENGKVVYDLEMTHKAIKYEMDIQDDGTLIEIEKEVKEPKAAVTKAVKEKYADAKITIVMEVNKVEGKKETPLHYEVTLTTGGKEKEVIVALDGSSVKEEAAEAPEKK